MNKIPFLILSLIIDQLLILEVTSQQSEAPLDSCFCQLQGQIDDCSCEVGTVDHFNNDIFYPKLQNLLEKPYFRYFQYNPNRPCPFWNGLNEKCMSSNCAVQSCTEDDLPKGFRDHETGDCHELLSDEINEYISESAKKDFQHWKHHDLSQNDNFCDLDVDDCPNCPYVDLTLNPERYTGYSGKSAQMVWSSIYKENCFLESATKSKDKSGHPFAHSSLEKSCKEQRVFFHLISGLHTSITIHSCANYPTQEKNSSPFSKSSKNIVFAPNFEEFHKRFHPSKTWNEGPFWLKNLYFLYLLELRALDKLSPYLEHQLFYTGQTNDDEITRLEVKQLLETIKKFPQHFDEHDLFKDIQLKEEFKHHFHNISQIMDCVGCDKCKLWGKLQIMGLGTALKILFADSSSQNNFLIDTQIESNNEYSYPFRLTRGEIVAFFNALGKISTSIKELEMFRKQMM